jgi:AcrR family transcriptional regulator
VAAAARRGAPREEIVEAAGVTRGALYHHFPGKEDLFRGVCEELEDEVLTRIAAAASGVEGGPLAMLRAGVAAYLDAALDPAVQRIVLLDAPAVLDWQVRHDIAEARALGLVRETLAAAMASGDLAAQPVEPLAHLLLASIHEAALYVARAPDADAARAERDDGAPARRPAAVRACSTAYAATSGVPIEKCAAFLTTVTPPRGVSRA